MTIGRATAKHCCPNESAIGKRIKPGGPDAGWTTIVGVVGDVHDEALTKPVDEMIYLPIVNVIQGTPASPDTIVASNTQSLTIRTSGDPMAVFPAVQREIWAIDRSRPLVNVRPLSKV